jgi:hypothetical protein
MDEEGFHAVAFLDVVVGYTGLQVEDGIRVKTEGFEDAVDFGVLEREWSVRFMRLEE